MPVDDGEQLFKGNSPIGITKIRNIAAIQSHPSVSNSLKRLRISSSWYPPFPEDRIYSRDEGSNQHLSRTQKADARTSLQESLPDNGIIRGGRPDRRICVKLIARYAFISYCVLSCVFVICRLYSSFYKEIHTTELLQPLAAVRLPTMEMSVMTNFLLKAMPCCTTFEPFVLSNDHKGGEVSFVGWLNESEVDSVREWSTGWPGPISILVTTAAFPGSPSHTELLRTLKTYSGITGLSIHLLFVQSDFSPTPNIYINLARLMARTNWTLLFPGDTSHHIAYNLHQSATRSSVKNAEDPFVLLSGPNANPALSPVLIKRVHSFWCTDRIFLNVSRKSDWDECLWQVALETFGRSVALNTAIMKSVERGRRSTPKGWTRQRLSARFRAEMCEIVIKRIAAVYPRNRQRALKVRWVRDFCAKTIDKKLTI